jgi:hypothetical protein
VRIRAPWARVALPTLACLLLAISLALAGCGGSSATTTTGSSGSTGSSTASTTASASFKTYSDGEKGYSFQYPAAWTVREGSTADLSAGGTAVASVGVYDPKGTIVNSIAIDMAQVSLYKLSVTVTDSMMSDIKVQVKNILSSLESQAGQINTLEKLTEMTINGMKGFKVTYGLTKEKAPVVSTMYFLFSGNMEYQVTVQAAEANWGADKVIFDSMLASFKPTA